MFFYPLTPKGRAYRKAAKNLYAHLVERAREPVFYAALSVPDTVDGRFEMISIHTGLVINRLRNEGKDGHRFAQSLFDEMFLKMEMSCRQIGIGDLSVPKHIKRMMKALQGRALIYDEAALSGRDALAQALKKNLYATVEAPLQETLNIMSDYMLAMRDGLKAQQFNDLLQARIVFPALPAGGSDVSINQAA